MSAKFILTDSQTKRSLNVEVEAVGGFLLFRPDGYEQCVSLDFFDGRLRLLVDTLDSEVPEIIDLEDMKCNLT